MAVGFKSGGRKAGTPNRRTQDIAAKLEGLGCDPVERMARLAMQAEEEGDKALAGKLYAELAAYVVPKRRAVQVEEKREWVPTRVDVEELKAQLRHSVGDEVIDQLEEEYARNERLTLVQ